MAPRRRATHSEPMPPRQEADHEQQEEAERELPGVREVQARERAHELEHERGDEDRQRRCWQPARMATKTNSPEVVQ